MIKAVIYARYSSHNQREESIEGQLRECQDFAQRNEMVIIGQYIDRAISGKTDNRADFQRMIKESEKGHFQAVIVYAIDRFARNRYDSATYKMRLRKNGVKVYYAKQSIPDTPEGIILESVMEGYAEYYSENLSIHIKRGLRENALQAKAVGKLPLGYRVGADKKIEIDPPNAKIVREIYQKYADGYSIMEIVNYCNERGYRTARGVSFGKNSLQGMLRNDKYTGTYHCADVVIENGMPIIVEKELFEKVQEQIKRNYIGRGRKKADEEYLLTGKLYCGHCGANMVGESGTARNGTTYYYYKCAHRKRNPKTCDKHTEQKNWIEKYIVQLTLNLLTDERIDLIAEKAASLLQKEAAENSILPSLKNTLREVEKRIKNIIDLMEQGIATPSTKERLLELESQKADITTRIAMEDFAKPTISKERIAFWLYSFRNKNIEDKEYRRKIIDTLVNSVYIYDINGGKGRRLVCTYNISGNNTASIDISDIEGYAPREV